MNVTELLRLLQAEHDETAARTDGLREQIEQLTGALAEAEARLAEIVTTRKVIDGLTPPDHEPRGNGHRLPAHRDRLQRASRAGLPGSRPP